jgi:hypothetical protein
VIATTVRRANCSNTGEQFRRRDAIRYGDARMKRETVLAFIHLVETFRHSALEAKRVARREALEVSDRQTIDRSVAKILAEVDVLERTLNDILQDPKKVR